MATCQAHNLVFWVRIPVLLFNHCFQQIARFASIRKNQMGQQRQRSSVRQRLLVIRVWNLPKHEKPSLIKIKHPLLWVLIYILKGLIKPAHFKWATCLPRLVGLGHQIFILATWVRIPWEMLRFVSSRHVLSKKSELFFLVFERKRCTPIAIQKSAHLARGKE